MSQNAGFSRTTRLENGESITIAIIPHGGPVATIGGKHVTLGGLEHIRAPGLAIPPDLPKPGSMQFLERARERDEMYEPARLQVSLPTKPPDGMLETSRSRKRRKLTPEGADRLRELAEPLFWLYLHDRQQRGDEIHLRQGAVPPDNIPIATPERAIYVRWPGECEPGDEDSTLELVITKSAIAFPRNRDNANVIHCLNESAYLSEGTIVAMPALQTHPFANPNPPTGEITGYRYTTLGGKAKQTQPNGAIPTEVSKLEAVVTARRPDGAEEERLVPMRYLQPVDK